MWLKEIPKLRMAFPVLQALFNFVVIPLASALHWTDPQTTYAVAGRNASLRCAINALPSNESITWIDSGVPIYTETSPLTQLGKYDNFHVTVYRCDVLLESVLHIESAASDDVGLYSCKYEDALQNVTSGNARLYVEASTGDCDEDLYRTLAIAFGVIACILLVTVGIILYVYHRWRRASQRTGNRGVCRTCANGMPCENTRNGETSGRGTYENELPMTITTTDREITAKQVGSKVPPRNIRFYSQIGPIGVTPFGQVWKGEIRGVPGKEKKKIQAAIRDLSGINGVNDLLEAVNAIWKLPVHINLVKCLGCCIEKSFIVYEYVPYGTLLTYLQTNAGKTRSSYRVYANVRSIVRRVKEPDLLRFAWQIAKGMEFLSSHKIVHGNLRASNVLLSENKICKIADYGLTSVMHPAKAIHRWLSPESLLTGSLSTECDVWSYGVLLWELVTLGAQPYPGVSDDELKERITNGYKMRRPRHCGEDLYNIITDCWKTEITQRSNFSDMNNKIGWILEGSNDYLSLNRMSDEDIYTDILELE